MHFSLAMQNGDGDGTCSCKEIPEMSMRQPEKDHKKHNVIFEEPFWFCVKSWFDEMSQTSTYTYCLFHAFLPFQPFFFLLMAEMSFHKTEKVHIGIIQETSTQQLKQEMQCFIRKKNSLHKTYIHSNITVQNIKPLCPHPGNNHSFHRHVKQGFTSKFKWNNYFKNVNTKTCYAVALLCKVMTC